MQSLDRIKLLQKEKLDIEKVELSEDEIVYVRQMTGREKNRFEQSLIKEVKNEKTGVSTYERTMEDFSAKLAVCTLCDEKGVALMEFADAPILSQNMSGKKLEKIVIVAQKLNGMSEIAKENALKNSDAGQTGNFNSDSVEK